MNERLIINQLREKLRKSIKRNPAAGLLFSGGLDTSILALLSTNIIAINVSLEDYSLDIKYATLLESLLKLKVYYYKIKIEEAISAIPNIIKILKSFDPAIPNDIPVYFGLKLAKKLQLRSIMTGDGADELFAGYDYMHKMNNLDEYIKRIAKTMYFNSNELGKAFGIEIKQPYMDKELIRFALENVPLKLKLNTYSKKSTGSPKLYGKWILRKAFENELPEEIIWQEKRPLEYGSGMSKLRQIISERISDKEFDEKSKLYQVQFLNKDHLYYYEIYKQKFKKIPKAKEGQIECPGCKTGLPKGTYHCRTCGYVLKKFL